MICEEALECPHCMAPLSSQGAMLRCPAGHSFDVARQGYVNLLPPKAHTGTADTPEMVAARVAFFAAGHFAALIERTADVVARAAGGVAGCIVDVGAGTGEYLAAALTRMPGRCGLALDVSKHACRRAAHAGEAIGAVVCDAWGRLPLKDESAAAIMSVFAPRNPAEFSRVLVPGGALVVVTPNPEHLASLVGSLGLVTVEPGKAERLEAQLEPYFGLAGAERLERELLLSREEVTALVGMGPSARHLREEELAAPLQGMDEPIATTLSVTIGTWTSKEGL